MERTHSGEKGQKQYMKVNKRQKTDVRCQKTGRRRRHVKTKDTMQK